jgi:hypothetical protein
MQSAVSGAGNACLQGKESGRGTAPSLLKQDSLPAFGVGSIDAAFRSMKAHGHPFSVTVDALIGARFPPTLGRQ